MCCQTNFKQVYDLWDDGPVDANQRNHFFSGSAVLTCKQQQHGIRETKYNIYETINHRNGTFYFILFEMHNSSPLQKVFKVLGIVFDEEENNTV